MQFSTLFVAALSAATAVSARSTASSRRQTCFVVSPDEYDFSVSQGYGDELEFDIGAVSAGPCSLIARFSAGFPLYESGSAQLNVFSGEGSNAPGALVGTVGPFALAADGTVAQDVYTTVNSFVCSDVLSFTFEIASEDQAGSVSFTSDDYNGFFIKVGDC
ncbi:hypothetical protein BX600DRAFT_519489 [Xylariales sp. PMI_506]|nr:hypothetical protein BX600DRAFT_519489 [Xylariales sp. PMI_506]